MRTHEPSAERDADGMWEPACSHCGLLAGPPFSAVVARFSIEAEAVAAAASILSMVSGEYHCVDEP